MIFVVEGPSTELVRVLEVQKDSSLVNRHGLGRRYIDQLHWLLTRMIQAPLQQKQSAHP